jgi:hypothetical protein
MGRKPSIDTRKRQAALLMIERGLATVGETAHLCGISRQYLHQMTRELKPREQRERCLKYMWDKVLGQLG